ncbi:MAG: hypothetical protein FJ319_11770 [SAR202 cluster bacterium]|nr:hypothetical protein [SAR202 cluster bacterium]
MKITVEISDAELEEIIQATGESKKGPAVRKIVTDALMLKRRERIAQKFISGEWGVDIDSFEAGQEKDRRIEQRRDEAWRS